MEGETGEAWKQGQRELNYKGGTNELVATLYGQFGCEIFMADRTGLGSTTLPGSTATYGELTQTQTFENHANLLTYLGKMQSRVATLHSAREGKGLVTSIAATHCTEISHSVSAQAT